MNEPIPLSGYLDRSRPHGMTPSGYTCTLLIGYEAFYEIDFKRSSFALPDGIASDGIFLEHRGGSRSECTVHMLFRHFEPNR